MNQSIWHSRKVLVTGHTGFKGSWLSLWLMQMGAEVTGYAWEPRTALDNFVVTGLAERLNHVIGDVRQFESLFDVFTKCKPEVVFHLAAQPLVRESYLNPKETFDINIGGTVNFLECCRLADSVKIIINVTSDKCYYNLDWVWGYRENDRLGGYDPYSSSKVGSEIVTEGYRNSFFNPDCFDNHGKSLCSVRAGNVIGGGDWQTDRLIPDCIRALEKRQPIIIRNPGAIRPWQHVLEPVFGYLSLAEKMYDNPSKYCGAWNFGPLDKGLKAVGEVVDLVVKRWGNGSWKISSDDTAPKEAHNLKLDSTKAVTTLGWRPVWSITEAVDAAIEWYKSYKTRDMYRFCQEQIGAYVSDCGSSGRTM